MDLVRDTRTGAGEKRRVAKEVVDEEVFGVVATDDRGETVHGNHLTTRITKTFTLSPRLPQGFCAVTDACEESVVMEGTHPATRITETLTIPHLTRAIGLLPQQMAAVEEVSLTTPLFTRSAALQPLAVEEAPLITPLLTRTIGSPRAQVLAKVSPITTTRTLPNKHQR
jgi:hypothetical protein